MEHCEHCEGTGEVCSIHGNHIGCDCDAPKMVECEACHGTGQPEDEEAE